MLATLLPFMPLAASFFFFFFMFYAMFSSRRVITCHQRYMPARAAAQRERVRCAIR